MNLIPPFSELGTAWLRISHGKSLVTVALRRPDNSTTPVGTAFALSGCWSMLKSGFTANVTGFAELYFESENATANIWVDSISVQPFTEQEWESHQIQSVEKVRKRKVRFRAVDTHGRPAAGAGITIRHRSNGFPLGNAITRDILTNAAYQNHFTSRFKLTVFGDEMKWYSTEISPGEENYTAADAMLKFAESHGITVRGHNILWDDALYQMPWVKRLSPPDLKIAVDKRIQSVAKRYRGKVIHWDVVNENLHWNFFESKLGANVSAEYYKRVRQIDPNVTLFLNEFNTLEYRVDFKSNPAKYLEKIKGIQSGLSGPLGIGLEGHFSTPDLAYVRSSLDVLASARLPIWITELDVSSDTNQSKYLDLLMRELFAHPAVNGIVLWGAWYSSKGCYRMCLTDGNFNNLPTGDVVDRILGEWKPQNAFIGATDANGYLESSLYHGHYEAKINGHEAITFKVDHSNLTTPQTVLIVAHI